MRAINLFLLTAGIFLSNKLFSQENGGELIPCQEISIGCRIVRGGDKFVIKNQVEYQSFLQGKQSSLLNCSGNEWPAIDFTKYTLLGITVGVSGCKEPSREYSIYYYPGNNSYEFNLTVSQKGYCKMLHHVDIWCLIPKISESATVDFKTTLNPIENENN